MANIIPFPSLGFVADEIPYELFEDLCESVYKSKKRGNEVNHILVGQISEEYVVNCSPPLLEYLSGLANKYNKEFGYGDWTGKYEITGMWANFQKKHEFNPVHKHTGDFSFVIWIKIPYDLEEESKQSHTKNALHKRTAQFSFYYTDVLGAITDYNLRVDNKYEGKIVLFPAKLCHSVQPFYTTDEERISVAGNLRLT